MRIIKLLALIAVSSFLFACGDDGGFFVPVSTGNKTFVANGGSADAALEGSGGGIGGGIFMDVYGDVKVRKTGTLNTSFTIPAYDYHFGSNKATVSVNTAIKLQGTDTIAAGDLFLIPNDSNLYISNGETGTVVTGLEVKPGVTLTVPVNWDSWAYFVVGQSVLIDGTVRTAADGADLDIESDSLFQIGATGLVTTKSATAGASSGDLYLYTSGVFINKGVIDASGADATDANGGTAGYAWVEADGFIYNTGSLLSLGGDSTTLGGGNGYEIGLYSFYASVHTSGVLDCSGGNGGGGNGGGVAYGIDIAAGANYDGDDNIGHLLVGGTLTANGGSGTGGNGGGAGYVLMESNGGKLWTSAAVSAKGGSSDVGGGYGGYFRILADYGDFDGEATVENWGIKITGNIDLSGGAGAVFGGYGGRLEVRNFFSGAGLPNVPAVEMLGYKSLSMNGGSGYYGAPGGMFQIETNDWFSNYGVALPVGSITNNVTASLLGGSGDSAAGVGGPGGWVYFWTNIRYGHDGDVVANNSAALDFSGGDGYVAGPGGAFLLYGYNEANNSGRITALGGDGVTGGPGAILNWGGVYFLSSYDVLNTGAIVGSGGFGDIQGGFGGNVSMFAGNQVKNKAAITVNGGDSDQNGGNGGRISFGSELVPTSNTGALKVFGGNGGVVDGAIGIIDIDGVDVTPI
jgi:hypothetical protein